MSLTKSIVAVNDDPQLVAKLRRLRVIEKDEHGEFVWAQVGGEFIGKGDKVIPSTTFKMYLGNEVEVPEDFARKLLVGYPVPLDEPCPQCWNEKLNKSTGFTIAGICHQCRGQKFIDLNRSENTFKLVKNVDRGDTFDPTKLVPPKAEKRTAATK